jgi:hypothetical protein
MAGPAERYDEARRAFLEAFALRDAEIAKLRAAVLDASETFERLVKLTPNAANARDAAALHRTVKAIAGCALDRMPLSPRGPKGESE